MFETTEKNNSHFMSTFLNPCPQLWLTVVAVRQTNLAVTKRYITSQKFGQTIDWYCI